MRFKPDGIIVVSLRIHLFSSLSRWILESTLSGGDGMKLNIVISNLAQRANKDVIIKKADKGSAVVIQNRTDYIEEGLRQLNDPKFYKCIDTDLADHHKS